LFTVFFFLGVFSLGGCGDVTSTATLCEGCVVGRSSVWKLGVVARLVFIFFFFAVFSLGGWGDATLTEAWELFSALLLRFFATGALIVTEDELLRVLFLIALLRGFVSNI